MDNESNIVAVTTDHETDKYTLFDQTLDAAGFYTILDRRWRESGKAKEDFFIVIKPNISMMLRRDDVGTYTDTFLVIHMLRRLIQRGFTHLAVVESQNLYGNWFLNRSVVQVAGRAGYYDEDIVSAYNGEARYDIHVEGDGVDHKVPLVDLTLDTMPFQFDDEEIMLGKTWVDADFRLNMSACKAHFFGHYTIAIKNVYGCLPEQDKVVAYHCKRKVGEWTARMIHEFPVHFSIALGYATADGWFGVKMKAIFNKTHTFIAGEDIMAVDHAGATLMDLDPKESIMYASLLKYRPFKPYTVRGKLVPFKNWRKVPEFLVQACILIENSANAMDYGGSIATGGNDPCFPQKENFGGSYGSNEHRETGWFSRFKGRLKWLTYYLSLPIAFFMDFDIVRVNYRKWVFKRELLQRREVFPMITGSTYLMDRLLYFSPEDLERFVGILKKPINGTTRFSGHYILNHRWEVPFPSRLFTVTIAAVEMLKYLDANQLSYGDLKQEIQTYIQIYETMYGKDTRYSFCYR